MEAMEEDRRQQRAAETTGRGSGGGRGSAGARYSSGEQQWQQHRLAAAAAPEPRTHGQRQVACHTHEEMTDDAGGCTGKEGSTCRVGCEGQAGWAAHRSSRSADQAVIDSTDSGPTCSGRDERCFQCRDAVLAVRRLECGRHADFAHGVGPNDAHACKGGGRRVGGHGYDFQSPAEWGGRGRGRGAGDRQAGRQHAPPVSVTMPGLTARM